MTVLRREVLQVYNRGSCAAPGRAATCPQCEVLPAVPQVRVAPSTPRQWWLGRRLRRLGEQLLLL